MSERVLRFDRPPHLPPPSATPILRYYDPDIRRVTDDARLEAPVDDRGVVDVFKTVELALSLVDPTYKWPRDKCDVHHFVWERAKYHPSAWDGDKVAHEYREIPFHKGYLPRQFHDFIHATIAPPPVPSYEVMRQRTDHSEAAKRLFETARQAISFDRRPEKVIRTDRVLDDEILYEVLSNMIDNFVVQQTDFPLENEFVAGIDLRTMSIERVARTLGKFAARSSINLLPKVYGTHTQPRLAA